MDAFSLLIADDHKVFVDGVRALLEGALGVSCSVVEAFTAQTAIELARQTKPDVALLDVGLPDMSGIEALPLLRESSPTTKILFLSMSAEPLYIIHAARGGASGYLLKNVGAGELVAAIAKTRSGKKYFCAEAAAVLAEHYETDPVSQRRRLTLRELEIAKLIAAGHTFSRIGERLHISPRTVETHQRNMLEKLELKNSTDLIRYIIERKLL